MPVYRDGETAIYYEERGTGSPVLLIAPGGMRSTVDYWSRAAIDPWDSFGDDFRLIAMDQRNAGRSRGSVDVADPWSAYAGDQLGLLDHLGIERFAVMGCCIGCSYALKLIEKAPERVVAGVLEQPIGVEEGNAALFAELQRSWAEEVVAASPELEMSAVTRFLAEMWQDGFVVSVKPEVVSECPSPLLVLPGVDEFHPTHVGHEIAAMAPDAQLVEPWKDTPEHVAIATEAVRHFLLAHLDGT